MKHIKLYENFITESVDPYFVACEDKEKSLVVFFKYDQNKPETDQYNIGRISLKNVELTGTFKDGEGIYLGEVEHTNNTVISEKKPEKVSLKGISQDTKVGDKFKISMVKDGKEVVVEEQVFFLMATNDTKVNYNPKTV